MALCGRRGERKGDDVTFQDLLPEGEVRARLEARGFHHATPIQAAAIPLALQGFDLIGRARTGTGKTLAYGVPLALRLSAQGGAPQALVLLPTRELALQVYQELSWIAPHLRGLAVYGGTGYAEQARALARGVDFVVATPGRALDYFRQGRLKLDQVQLVVLDEADEMLSMGFEEEVEALLKATPSTRQTLLFSATLPTWTLRLAARYQNDPLKVDVVQEESLSYEELALELPLAARAGALPDLLYHLDPERAIVFVRTKVETGELAKALRAQGLGAAALQGDLSQKERERVLEGFRRGEEVVLVATDLAARGLDIPEVDLVVHYHLPERTEAYQHRSGRTGRAGRRGRVLLFFGPRERRKLEELERALSRRFRRIALPSLEERQEARWRHLERQLKAVSPQMRAAWRPWADRLQDPELAASLLAFVLGAPEPRSQLTGEEGWVTRFLIGKDLSVGRVVALLKRSGAKQVGRVELAPGGAWVDLRSDERLRLPPGVRFREDDLVASGG